jgi:hypothetical protein
MVAKEAPSESIIEHRLIGLSALTRMAFTGTDLDPIQSLLLDRINRNPRDAAAFLDLSTIAHLQARPHDRRRLQARALKLASVFRQASIGTAGTPVRLLVFMAPGDFMANMPIEFMLDGNDVALDIVYVEHGYPTPQLLPEHDVAYVAVSASCKQQRVLRLLEPITQAWPRPVINAPARIARLTRDGAWALLNSTPGVVMPVTARVDRAILERLARNDLSVTTVLTGSNFPIIARPLDSHSGEGLSKLDNRADVENFLNLRREDEFHIAPFIDYRGRDGLFRKYRIVLIERRPYACHMAISPRWMIHYFNADMMTSADHRAEESRFMATFDEDFAVRHATALGAIAERVDLDYVPLDCGETRDGRLLIFEIGTNMIIHAMDSLDVFPYKRPQMEKVFAAFTTMLRNAARRRPGIGMAA